jgi:hypothetical protein
MRTVYKYHNGSTVWTIDGIKWFITDDDRGTTKPINKPIMSKVALDITKVGL